MKRRFNIVIGLILLLVIATNSAIAAPNGGATTKNLSTNYTLVNMSGTDAAVSVQYIQEGGSAWPADAANTSFTVPKDFGQKIVAQYFDSTLSNGRGSAVITSNQPLSAVAQILARGQTPTSGAYTGASVGSSKFYVPLILRKRSTASGLVNSQIIIQNVDTIAANFNIQFTPSLAGYSSYTTPPISLNSGESYYWDAADESAANLADGWSGSAVVLASDNKKVVVVSNLFSGPNGLQTFNAFAEESAAKNWVVPLFTSRLTNKLSTPVAIQNVSGTQIGAGELSMTCNSTISTPASFTVDNGTTVILDSAAFYFNPVADTNLPADWSGACTISSSQNVVVFVQMRRPGKTDEVAAYEAFPANSTDTKVVVPLMSKRQSNGFATVATIQNLDLINQAEVTLRYIPSTSYTGSQTSIVFDRIIPAGGNLIQSFRYYDVPEVPDLWYGTLIVEPKSGTTPRPIVGFVQLTNYKGATGDTLMAHGAFTLP